MMHPTPRLRATIAALALTLVGAGVTPVSSADQPYEINAIVSLTGSAAFLGKEEQQALEAVEKVQNARGGIKGRKIHFAIADDQSNPQVSVQLLNAVVAKKVPVILGSSLVAQCNAMAALVKDNGPLHYCFSPGIHPEHGGYTFSSSVSTRDQAIAMLRFFHKRGWNRLALLTSTDATGQDAERNFVGAVALAENRGMQLVAQEHFNPSDVSVTAQLREDQGHEPAGARRLDHRDAVRHRAARDRGRRHRPSHRRGERQHHLRADEAVHAVSSQAALLRGRAVLPRSRPDQRSPQETDRDVSPSDRAEQARSGPGAGLRSGDDRRRRAAQARSGCDGEAIARRDPRDARLRRDQRRVRFS